MIPPLRALLLAAGVGSRLAPLTHDWPKCLMPINGIPLLTYWITLLENLNIPDTVINTHHHADVVEKFILNGRHTTRVHIINEPELLGTAGTLLKNIDLFRGGTSLVIHADNFCMCDFQEFLNFHFNCRPSTCVMSMMTFESTAPQTCGILNLNELGIVEKIYEKVPNPPGTLANGAVYLIEPEVLDWMHNNPDITDFSTEVLPAFLGRIATWKNTEIHRDIGTISALKAAQLDRPARTLLRYSDEVGDQLGDNYSIFKGVCEKINSFLM